jgi:hypothetical protein
MHPNENEILKNINGRGDVLVCSCSNMSTAAIFPVVTHIEHRMFDIIFDSCIWFGSV